MPQEHPEPTGKKRKHLSSLKESMLKAKPVPKLHAKATETKGLLEFVSIALQHFADQGPGKRDLPRSVVVVFDTSHAIDVLIDGLQRFCSHCRARAAAGNFCLPDTCGHQEVVPHISHADLVHFPLSCPKTFHLSTFGRHMSPKLTWCYQGEGLMNKVKGFGPGQLQRHFSQDTWQQNPGNICFWTLPNTVQVSATSLPAEKGPACLANASQQQKQE